MPTPVERLGDVWAKRDDLYVAHGAPGGKARTCLAILSGEDSERQLGLRPVALPQVATRIAITASSRHSPQAVIVARIAAGLGLRCRIHMPAGDHTPEIMYAQDVGAEIVRHRPGYNSVIVARARQDANATGAIHVPFGMECMAAVEQTALEFTHTDIPEGVRRIVVPVGSGMSLAGVLRGMIDLGFSRPVVGVQIGANPTRRLDQYAVPWWRDLVRWEYVPHRYGQAVQASLSGVRLDPIYEAKCVPFLRPDDLFWIVGIRANLVPATAENGAKV